jgi:hypothetical protein
MCFTWTRRYIPFQVPDLNLIFKGDQGWCCSISFCIFNPYILLIALALFWIFGLLFFTVLCNRYFTVVIHLVFIQILDILFTVVGLYCSFWLLWTDILQICDLFTKKIFHRMLKMSLFFTVLCNRYFTVVIHQQIMLSFLQDKRVVYYPY